MPPLLLDRIRETARKCRLEEIYLNETSKVISFRSSSNRRCDDDTTRYNIYYTTGTVCTSLDHPRQGKTQLFRRNVNLQLLEEIFLNPRIHTDLGYQHTTSTSSNKGQNNGTRINEDPSGVEGEEESAQKQLAKLLAEKIAIDKELMEVQAILYEHEHRRQEKQRLEHEERERKQLLGRQQREREDIARSVAKLACERRERGESGSWNGLKEAPDFKKDFRSDTTCIAIGDDGTHLCLYEDGDYAYSSGLTTNLRNKLHTRARSHPSPEYVAMGSQSRYYIRFANGKYESVGPSDMYDLLKKEASRRTVKSVAFGEDYSDYFVVFDDGYWEWGGNIPTGLLSILKARKSKSDLNRVSLGSNGEWFLRANNGKTWWDEKNVSDVLWKDAKKITDEGGYIKDMQFGCSGTYFIRYE